MVILMKYFNEKFAFTLSEVLITLVIIGVVAAITVPVLFANYQEKAIKSSLKKNYSALTQALTKYQADNSQRLMLSDIKDEKQMKSILKEYMMVMYDCDEMTGEKACLPTSKNGLFSDSYKNYSKKTNLPKEYYKDGQLVLQDGSLIMIDSNITQIVPRLYILVDVNGFGKKPNIVGRDVFAFQLSEDGHLLPMGSKGTNFNPDSDCSKTSASPINGLGCTYKMLID